MKNVNRALRLIIKELKEEIFLLTYVKLCYSILFYFIFTFFYDFHAHKRM